MIDFLEEIYSTIRRNKLRTFLTGFSVAWGIFILIFLMGSGNGLINAFQKNSGDIITNSIKVYPGWTHKAYKGLKENRRIILKKNDLDITSSFMANVDNVSATLNQDDVTLSKGMDNIKLSLIGVMPNYPSIDVVKIKSGRFINKLDIEQKRKNIVLHENTVEILFGKKDANVIGQSINASGLNYVIVGVYTNDSSFDTQAIIPYTTLSDIYGKADDLGTIAFVTKDLNTVEANDNFEKKYRKAIGGNHKFDPTDKSALYLWNRMTQDLQQKNAGSIIRKAVWVISILTLLSGIVGISNIMLITVKERTREFGIRKALGAKPYSILGLIISESIIITTIFGYIGMVLGIAVTEYMNYDAGSKTMDASLFQVTVFENPTVDLHVAIQATLTLIIAGTIAGFFPARKAVMIRPIEALRAE